MKKSSITLFHLTAHLQNIFTQGRRMPISEKRPGKTSVHKLLVFLFAFSLFGGMAEAQTTVTYTMQTGNFNSLLTEKNNNPPYAGTNNNGGSELSQYANGGSFGNTPGAAAFETFNITGNGNSGTARTLKVGDKFTITGYISTNPSAGGYVGVSFRNSTTYTNFFSATDANTVARFQLDNTGNWKVYSGGTVVATSSNASGADATFTIEITSSNTFNATIGLTTWYDLSFGATGPVSSFAIYTFGDSNANSFWKNASLTNFGDNSGTGLRFGYDLASGTRTISGVISDGTNTNGTGGSLSNMVLSGGSTGFMIFTGTNTYTGSTTVNTNARLELQNTAALGSTTGVTVSNNATLSLYFASGTNTFNSYSTTLNGNGPGGSDGALRSTGGNNTWPGGITLASASRINADATGAAGSLTISGTVTLGSYALTVGGATSGVTISGKATGSGGSLVKDGNNKLTLSNTTNDYTGTTTISAGTLELGGADVIPNNAMTLIGGTLSTGSSTGYNETIGVLTLSSSSTISFGSGSHTLTFSASNAPAWSGTLTIRNWTSTGAKLYFGANGSGLTSTQLSNINFTDFGTGARILSTGEVIPATYYSAVATGSWDAGSSWVGGSVPSASTDIIVIQSGHNITLNTDATVASLTINSGGTFTSSNGSARILTITKSTSGSSTTLSNSGTWANGSGTSTVVFTGAPSSGNAIHTIYGSIGFQNITVNKTGGTSDVGCSFGATSSVSGTLEIGTGGYISTAPPTSFYGTSAILKFNQGFGATYNVTGGDFSWSTTEIPNFITISSGTVNLNASRIATGNLLIDGGALVLNLNAPNLTIQGNWTRSSGTFSSGTGTVTLSGTTNGTVNVTGGGTMNNLTINKTSGASANLASDITVTSTLTITAGTLSVDPGKSLTVTGTTSLDVAECLVLKSDATGTASFKDNGTISGTGTVKVERFLTKYTSLSDKKFHFISSPVAAQHIRTEFVANTPASDVDFFSWDEVQYLWINSKVPGPLWNSAFESDFIVGKGYMVAYPTDILPKNFTGTLNTGTFTTGTNIPALTYTTGKGNGWNLLGNPYPSAIDWTLVTLGNGVDNALYYYDAAIENYRYYIQLPGETGSLGGGSRYIPAMQGFMVHAKSTGTKTITFENADRVHNSLTTFYKSTSDVPGSLALTVKAGNYEDIMFVHFTPGTTTKFDGAFDAYKLTSYNTQVPQIYTKGSDDSNLAINGLPELNTSVQIPVYFKAGVSGQQTITADVSQMTATVYLTDLKTSTTHNLNQQPEFNFNALVGDNPSRFLLHFSGVGINETAINKQFSVYSSDNNLMIISNNENTQGNVYIYNLMGQLVKIQELSGEKVTRIGMDLPTGYYLVKIISGDHAFSEKVFVK